MLAPVLIVIIALAACAVQQWLGTAHGEVNVALIFDSGHYQKTAQLILDCLSSTQSPAASQAGPARDLASALILDGPVLPGLGAIAMFVFGKLSGLADWQCFINLQAILHALSALLVYMLAGKVRLTEPDTSSHITEKSKQDSYIDLVYGRRLCRLSACGARHAALFSRACCCLPCPGLCLFIARSFLPRRQTKIRAGRPARPLRRPFDIYKDRPGPCSFASSDGFYLFICCQNL